MELSAQELIKLAMEAGRANGRLDEMEEQHRRDLEVQKMAFEQEVELTREETRRGEAILTLLGHVVTAAGTVIAKKVEANACRRDYQMELDELHRKIDEQHQEFHARLSRLSRPVVKKEEAKI
jgi:hypothetical protein